MDTLTLEIARTWDGKNLPPEELATITAKLHPDRLELTVDAPFSNDPSPPSSSPGPTDKLWEHEVIELFLCHGSRYTEIELGPHGHHLVLRLDGVRQVVEEQLPIDFEAEILGERWKGKAVISSDLLPPLPLTGNAYAIRGSGKTRRFDAMTPVPGKQPDFHQLDRFLPLRFPSL